MAAIARQKKKLREAEIAGLNGGHGNNGNARECQYGKNQQDDGYGPGLFRLASPLGQAAAGWTIGLLC